jgi:hypothetical protein
MERAFTNFLKKSVWSLLGNGPQTLLNSFTLVFGFLLIENHVALLTKAM